MLSVKDVKETLLVTQEKRIDKALSTEGVARNIPDIFIDLVEKYKDAGFTVTEGEDGWFSIFVKF